MNTSSFPWNDNLSTGDANGAISTTCKKFGPGHEVYWMRALHYVNNPRSPRTCSFVSRTSETVTVRFDDDEMQQTLWTHEPQLLERALNHIDGREHEIVYDGGFLTFWVRREADRTGVHIDVVTEKTPCDFPRESEQVMAQ